MSFTVNPLKILLLGDPSTGKTSYCRALSRLLPGKKQSNELMRAASYLLNVRINHSRVVPIEIYNPSVLKTIDINREFPYNDIDGVIIMFDVTDPCTYDHLFDWKNHCKCRDNTPIMILANKCDLERNSELSASILESENYCRALGFFTCVEISTVTENNIELSIHRLVQKIIEDLLTKEPRLITLIRPINNLPSDPTLSVALPDQITMKIILLGDYDVGKTAIMNRYTRNIFNPIYQQTMGVDMLLKKIRYNNSTTITMHIWDIAGRERNGNLTPMFYRDAVGCLIAFDLTRRSTLTFGAVEWKKDVDNKLNNEDGKSIPCLLLGNKCDLNKNYVVPNEREMQNFCDEHNFLRWFPTSAKTNTNVSESFSFLVDAILQNYSAPSTSSADNIRLTELELRDEKPSSGCSGC